MINNITRAAWVLALILALIFTAGFGCNNGDDDDDSSGDPADDDDDTEEPPFEATSIEFTADPSQGAGEIRLELLSVDVDNNAFVLNVIGDGIQGAYGIAGRLEFDRQIAGLDNAEPGDALESQGAEVLAMGASNDEGGVFGVSRSVDYESSVDLSADKVVGTLHFSVTAAGETKIDFNTDRSVGMDHDFESVEIEYWTGGTLKVQ